MARLPLVACTLDAGDLAEQAARWQQLRATAEHSREETADGFRLTFTDTPWVETELRALAAVESDCCSWARWSVAREAGKLVLTVSSTAHGIAALHTMLRG